MSSSTKYLVQSLNLDTNEFESVAQRSEKGAAIALASKTMIDEHVTTRVVSTGGKLIETFEFKSGGKRVRRSAVWAKPYTRIRPINGATVTEDGQYEIAYYRPRRDAATLRKRVVNDEGKSVWSYAIARGDGTILVEGIMTTRATSAYMTNVTKVADLNTV